MTVHSLTGVLPGREEYPQTWDEYIGQEEVKRQIKIAAQSARIRGDVMSHILIHSTRAGVGKTALAYLIAKELGKPMRTISGRVTEDDLRIILAQCALGDVLFYDEVHNVAAGGKKNGDFMLTFLENGVIVGPQGPERQPRVTFIGATTNVRMLGEPLRTRFARKLELGLPTDDEAIRIGRLMVSKLFHDIKEPSTDNLAEIAFAANNTPRVIRNILENLRDLIVTEEADRIGGGWDISEALVWVGVTPDGLTTTALKYLVILLNSPAARAGKDSLADQLHEENGMADIERLLLEKGLISLTGRGRQLTQAGIARALEAKRIAEPEEGLAHG